MPTTNIIRAGLAAALLAAPLPLWAQSETPTETPSETPGAAVESADIDTVVATVNGTEVTLGQMIVLRSNVDKKRVELHVA